MNNLLNEYLRFNFELNIELNHFLARFNVKMNNQNVSLTPKLEPPASNPFFLLLGSLTSDHFPQLPLGSLYISLFTAHHLGVDDTF